MPTPVEGNEAEVGSTSESGASLPTTGKMKEISMNALGKMSLKAYPCVPAARNKPLMQKLRKLVEQEFMDPLIVKFRFGSMDPAPGKVFA